MLNLSNSPHFASQRARREIDWSSTTSNTLYLARDESGTRIDRIVILDPVRASACANNIARFIALPDSAVASPKADENDCSSGNGHALASLSFDKLVPGSQKVHSVCVIVENCFAPVPSAKHMINRTRILDAQRPGH
jgi:hypothetical protein